MGTLVGLASVAAAVGLAWACRQVGRLGVDLVRQTRTALRGTRGVRATCVASGTTRHTYRFATPDGVSRDVYVPRTSEHDRGRVGSHARLRYRTDDPGRASYAVVDTVVRPLGAVLWFLLAAFCAASAAVLLALGWVTVF
ncbi:hypothetical protein [Streptomyces sp. JB150]|uniref:hypothetical protein n=1 Tax=Streptomyces sp. JB150 TaxID=2714844 RepID=UPI00140A7EE7|nr:hypothetical protein [Streptomyces sp. JB150]QIJ63790.1 hypothetical protein G7Z13_18535 [Streptomyces sp. JB150]